MKLSHVYNYVGIFILCFIFVPALHAADISQSNWTGGSGQTSFSDGSKFSTYANLDISTANQLKLTTNFGTGADGPCTITGEVTLDGSSGSNTCAGKATADAVSTSISSLIPNGSTSLAFPDTHTFTAHTLLSTGTRDIYNDQQKWVRMGPDNLPRFVYLDTNGFTDIHFVRCLDATCSTKQNTVVASNANGPDEATINMGSDGFARIAYVSYDSPNQFHFIQCLNADCTSKTDNSVDTGSYYENSFTLNANNFGRMVINDYNSNHLYMTVCTNASCSTHNKVDLGAINYGSTMGIISGTDGFVHMVYYDTINSTRAIYVVHCQDDACSSHTTNLVTTISPGNSYYNEIIPLGGTKYGILFLESSTGKLDYIVCNDEACASHTSPLTLDNTSRQLSMVVTSTGLPRILFQGDSNAASTKYIVCNNQSCSSKTVYTVSITDAYPLSLTLASDDSPRIFAQDYIFHNMRMFTEEITPGTPPFAVGDEVIVMDQKGTSTDYSNVGSYDTRYITKIANASIYFDVPLSHTYDGTSQSILVQRIPQYTSVSFNPAGSLPSSNTAAKWNFDESSYNGTSGEVVDSSGNSNNGTSHGVTTTTGFYNRAASFDGSSYISVPNSSSLSPTSAITISAWIKVTGGEGSYRTIVSKPSSTSWTAPYGSFELRLNGANKVEFWLNDGGVTTNYVTSRTSIPVDGNWYFVAGTFDGTTEKMYINGSLDSTNPLTASIATFTEPLVIGTNNANVVAENFVGLIDDLRIYNRALTAAEIAAPIQPKMTVSAYSSTSGTGGLLFFRALGTVNVNSAGTISAKGKGYTGGIQTQGNGGAGGETYNGSGGGGVRSGAGASGQGGGGGTGSNNSGGTGTIGGGGGGGGNGNACSGDGGGGAGGGYATVGSAGGGSGNGATAGTNGSGATGGNGGSGPSNDCGASGGGGGGTYGTASLTPLFMGSGGGGAGGSGTAGAGGNGGGIVSVVAKTITIASGSITSDGGNGVDGYALKGGGGGGAGGSIRLLANTLSLGSSNVTAAGGTGGTHVSFASDGGAGGTGRIGLYSPASISGTTSPSANTISAIGNATSGTLISSVFDTNQASDWGTPTYTAITPANTSVVVRVRSSNNADMSGATDFSNCADATSGQPLPANDCAINGQRYVQYYVRLNSSDPNATPTFSSFKLEYGPHGQSSNTSAFVDNPNKKTGYAKEINAGPDFVGEVKPLSNVEAPDASALIAKDAVHDPLNLTISISHIEDLANATPQPIPMPWTKGFTIFSEIYTFRAVSAFNGFSILRSDKPYTITLPYNPALLKGMSPTRLRILYYDPVARTWKVIQNNTVLNWDKHTISNTTTYFTYFAVGYGYNAGSGTVQGAKTKVVPKGTTNAKPKK